MKLHDAVKQVRFTHPDKDVHECVDLVIITGNFDEINVMREVAELKGEYAQWCLGMLDLDEDGISQEIKRIREGMLGLVV